MDSFKFFFFFENLNFFFKNKTLKDKQTGENFFFLFAEMDGFFFTWDGRFSKKKTNKHYIRSRMEKNQTWDGVDNRL